MSMIISLSTILVLGAVAELSRQTVHESELSNVIKKFCFLDGESIGRWKKRGSVKNWWNLTGRWFFPLIPFVAVVVLFSWLMVLLGSLLDCDKCLGYHLGWLTLYFILGYSLTQSLVIAPLVILWVYVIERIKR